MEQMRKGDAKEIASVTCKEKKTVQSVVKNVVEKKTTVTEKVCIYML